MPDDALVSAKDAIGVWISTAKGFGDNVLEPINCIGPTNPTNPINPINSIDPIDSVL